MFSDINKEGLLSSIINAAFRDLENIFSVFPPLPWPPKQHSASLEKHHALKVMDECIQQG